MAMWTVYLTKFVHTLEQRVDVIDSEQPIFIEDANLYESLCRDAINLLLQFAQKRRVPCHELSSLPRMNPSERIKQLPTRCYLL